MLRDNPGLQRTGRGEQLLFNRERSSARPAVQCWSVMPQETPDSKLSRTAMQLEISAFFALVSAGFGPGFLFLVLVNASVVVGTEGRHQRKLLCSYSTALLLLSVRGSRPIPYTVPQLDGWCVPHVSQCGGKCTHWNGPTGGTVLVSSVAPRSARSAFFMLYPLFVTTRERVRTWTPLRRSGGGGGRGRRCGAGRA